MNNQRTTDNPRIQVFQVSTLLNMVRKSLEASFSLLWLEGEVSNFTAAASGHWYFTLKDNKGQIRCTMFAGKNRYCRVKPRNGDKVVVRARVGLYEVRGDLQLNVEWLEPAGAGALQLAFLELKERLQAEGLFDAAKKMPLPESISTVGVVTSPDGAAIHDILSVLRRRNPFLTVVIYPCQVQGADAPRQIRQATATAFRRREVDVLILTRGGGSLEDLWAFNDEALARLLARRTLPVVSAVGHEVDFTICDWVADARAPTPSAAAELVSRDFSSVHLTLGDYRRKLVQSMERYLDSRRQRLDLARLKLPTPSRVLELMSTRIGQLESRLYAAMDNVVRRNKEQHRLLAHRLWSASPEAMLQLHRNQWARSADRLHQVMHDLLRQKRNRLQLAGTRLDAASPLAILARGYSVTEKAETGELVTAQTPLSPGDLLRTRLARRSFLSTFHSDETTSQ
jgi:exodeoxyribonuclease VII large subunit